MAGHSKNDRLLPTTLAALGIVFGDIGTSPMYAMSESLKSPGIPAGAESILGIVSLILWSLFLIVSIKYLFFITRANNKGEGGIFAIVALLKSQQAFKGKAAIILTTSIAIAAAALLFADSLITPALSVMAATEGLKPIFSGIDHWIMLASIVILTLLFAIQRLGTSTLSRLFTPVMLIWFSAIGLLGLKEIVDAPEILRALSPVHAYHLLKGLTLDQVLGLLGSILLAVTGAEAIYADMGHFGRKPISFAWYLFALNGLILNYFGQGAWLLKNPLAGDLEHSPFFAMLPVELIIPMVILATLASVIASQAVISGMFSLANQAIQLEYLPRLKIFQTSKSHRGQIYVKEINTLLAMGCILLVLIFGSSSALASAYGFAVSATMLLTTIAFTLVIYFLWRWSPIKVLAFCCFAIPLDGLFFAATITKLPEGHYLTLIIAVTVAWLLAAWILGTRYLVGVAQRIDLPIPLFVDLANNRKDLYLQKRPAIFFQHLPFPPGGSEIAPTALLRQVQLTSMLYQPTVIVDFMAADTPRINENARITAKDYEKDIHFLTVAHGFAEGISIHAVILYGQERGWWKEASEIVYFSGREDLRAGSSHRLPLWIRWPFVWLHHYDRSLPSTLKLPAMNYVELGLPIDL